MNMNQITNMILRQFMRKAVNTGINSGMKAMSGKGQKKPRQVVERTEYTAPQARQVTDTSKPTQAEVRARRRAKQEIRQARRARQAAK